MISPLAYVDPEAKGKTVTFLPNFASEIGRAHV